MANVLPMYGHGPRIHQEQHCKTVVDLHRLCVITLGDALARHIAVAAYAQILATLWLRVLQR